MSKEIDEKVVSMEFDNKKFESNVQTSMSTIDKLKKSLNFNGASKGLDGISESAKKVDMSSLSKGAETVQAKFSALQVIGVTALANITNSAVNAGKRIVSAFTIDPVKTGFSEYELKMGSIQTIMASTGESLATVNGYLDELNAYSDKTIYSFSDMTSNIGKFTNAGVKLEDAVLAIKGVSNEAAISGANANEASRAMYNFAQALSAGYVKLIDWKSIESANMATVQFKNQLLESAVAAGTLTKTADGMYKTISGNVLDATHNFNDTLQDQWMTTEALVNTLKDYADETTEIGKKAYSAAQDVKTFSQLVDTLKEAAQSGWAETWQLIVGDFDEAKDLFTRLSNFFGDIIGGAADARNAIVSGFASSPWKKLSSRIKETGINVNDFQKALIETGKAHGVVTDDMIDKAGSFEKSLKSGWLSNNIIVETLKKYIDTGERATEVTTDMTQNLKQFDEVVTKVIRGDFGNGADRVKRLTEAGYEYATVQGLVNERLLGTKFEIQNMSDAQLKSVGYTSEQIDALRKLAEEAEKTGTPLNELIQNMERPSGRELLVDTILNAVNGLSGAIKAIREAWNEIVPPEEIQNGIYNFTFLLNNMSKKLVLVDESTGELNKTGDNLKRTFKGVFAIFDLITDIVGGGLKTAFNLLREVMNALGLENFSILDITASVGDALVAFRAWVWDHDLLTNAFATLSPHIVKAATAIAEFAKSVYNSGTVQKILGYISDAIDVFNKGIDSGATCLENWISSFVNLVKKVKDIPAVSKVFTAFSDIFSTIYKNLSAYVGPIKAYIDEFISCIKSVGELTPENVAKAFKDFPKKVADIFGDLPGIFSGISENAIAGLENGLSSGWKGLKDKLSNLALSILEIVKTVLGIHSPSTEFKDIGGNVISGLCEGLENGIGKVITAIGEVIKGLVGYINTIDWSKIFVGGLTVGGGVFLFKIADMAKDLISPITKLGDVFGSVAGGISKLSKSASKWIDAKTIGVKANALLTIAKAISTLALAIIPLTLVDTGKLWIAVGAVTVLAGEMVALLKLTEKSNPTAFGKLSVMMISVAASLVIMAIALKKISSIEPDRVKESVDEVIILFGAMTGMLIAFTKLTKGDQADIDKAGIMLLKMSVAIGILAVVVKIVSKLSMSDIGKGLAFITGVTILFAAVIAVSKFAGENGDKAGSMLLKMSIAIGILALTVKIVSSLSTGDLIKGGVFVAGCLVLFTALVKVSQYAGANAVKAGGMLMMMAGSMAILALSVRLVAGMSPNDIKKGIVFVGAVMLMYAVLIEASDYAGKYAARAGAMFLLMSGAILILVASVAVLSFLNPKDVERGTICISLMMGMFSLMALASKGLKIDKTTYSALIVMCAALGVVTAAIAVVAHLNPDTLLPSVLALSTLLTSLSISLKLISSCVIISNTALISMGVITLVLAAVATILAVLSSMNIEISMNNVLALSAMILALSGCCVVLSLVPLTGATAGIIALAELVGGLTIIIGILGGLNELTNGKLKQFLDEGIPILQEIGYGLGSFLGNIVGGFVGGMLSGLTGIGTDLSSFMTNLQPFLDGANSIDPSTIEGVKALAETVLILTAADILSGIASFLGCKGSIVEFAEQLQPLGAGMKAYADEVFGMDSEVVTNSANAAKAISELVSNLPRKGGWMGAILGEKMSLSEFATYLEPFGVAIKSYADEVAGIDSEAATNSANAANTISELVNNLPRKGGWMGAILGEKMSLSEFGTSLIPFGAAIKAYALSMANMDPSVVTNSADAAQVIADLTTGLPNQGGAVSWFTGDNTLADFGANIETFGLHFAEYYKNIRVIHFDILEKSIEEAEAIIKMTEHMSDIDTSGMSSFGLSLTILGNTGVDNFIAAFDNATTRVKNASYDMVTKLVSGAVSKTDSIRSAFSDLASAAASEMENHKNDFYEIGCTFANKMIEGINYKKHSLATPVSSIVRSMLTEANCYHDFYNTGANLATGFANGISANTYKASAKAKAMAQAAVNAARKVLDEHSPSKVFYKIGDFAGVAFVNALESYEDKAGRAGADMANSATLSINEAVSRINSMVSNNLDYEPVIRPVLDLSNVQNGARNVSSMFGASQSVDLANGISGTRSSYAASPINVEMTINGAPGQDINQLADIVSDKLATVIRRRESVWQ